MTHMSPTRRSFIAVLLALFGLVATHGDALAGTHKKGKKAQKYHFEIEKVTAAEGVEGEVAADVLAMLKAEAEKQFAAHPQLNVDMSTAPDPSDVKAYKAWLKKKKIAGSFMVVVDVTLYREELEDKDDGSKRLAVRLELHMFGETIPERKMGFEGVGSSTVKQDVGKKMRPKDREYTVQSAIELAVQDAIAECMTKLGQPPAKPMKK